MAALYLIDEKTGQSWEVWPGAGGLPPGAVHELGSYLFELRECASADSADLLLDERPLEALRSKIANSARWRWQPGFHAGAVQAELRIPERPACRFDVVTDPDLRKLTRDNFDTMVREIIEDTFALFSLSSFRKTVARGNGNKPPAIARLEFLRSRIEELEGVVTAIVRNPRRRLTAEEHGVPYYRASHATGQEILRSFRSGKILRESASPARLPLTLRGSLPASIRIRRKLNSTDIPEHRQIGACLRSWSTWLNAAADQLEAAGKSKDDQLQKSAATWTSRCRNLARRTTRLASLSPFNEAGAAPSQISLSALFRNDPVYRRFYQLWQDINRGIAAVFGEFLDMPLARTWELYELWCFLRLLRAAAEEFGPDGMDVSGLFTSESAGGVTIAARAVTVQVGSGWALCFQKQYREFWIEADGHGSFTRTMEPDIVAMWNGEKLGEPSKLIVLDAKYRIDSGLNDAIGSIHTYRDALVEQTSSGHISGIVSAAYLLTPHLALQQADGDYRDSQMPGRLFQPDYQAAFRFGAVTLKPGMSHGEIVDTLKRVVAEARTAN